MKDFKNTMVAMDLSEMDEQVLGFVKMMSKALDIKKLDAIHVIPDLLMPENSDLQFHQLFGIGYPLDERIKDKMDEKVTPVFGNNGVETTINVVEGKPYEKLLHWAEVKESDLVVIGKKSKSSGSGITAKKVARKVSCNVLFVPAESPKTIKKILVPIDFSENSARAMLKASELSQALDNVELTCLYIGGYVPSNYYLDLHINEAFEAVYMDNAKNAWKIFKEKYGFRDDDYNIQFGVNRRLSSPIQIHQFAQMNNVDLIVMGAKGKTAFQRFAYGSVTEELLNICDDKPILVVR